MQGMSAADMPSLVGAETRDKTGSTPMTADLRALDKLVPVMQRLSIPPPIWISPPSRGVGYWTISSHVQDRPRRVTYLVDPERAVVESAPGFGDLNIVDQVVNVGVAAHEGQLFGRLNQAILLLNAAALLLLSASATLLWWSRRPAGSLGAPPPSTDTGFSLPLMAAIAALAIALPLFGLSLMLMLAVERMLLRRFRSARLWLGFGPFEV